MAVLFRSLDVLVNVVDPAGTSEQLYQLRQSAEIRGLLLQQLDVSLDRFIGLLFHEHEVGKHESRLLICWVNLEEPIAELDTLVLVLAEVLVQSSHRDQGFLVLTVFLEAFIKKDDCFLYGALTFFHELSKLE